MKKFILGLLLAVGVSGVSYARNSVGVKETTGSKVIKACYSSTITNYVDAEGNLLYSEQSRWVEIPCGDWPDGTKVIKTKIVQEKSLQI
ncbi:hypothetical protein AAH994_09810 [Weeksellaceae bacterium A-14]